METKDLHDQIMNIRIYIQEGDILPIPEEYRRGHRDACHAAAELAIESDQLVEALDQQISKLKNQIKLLLDAAKKSGEKSCGNCVTNDGQDCRDCFRDEDPSKDILVDRWVSPKKEAVFYEVALVFDQNTVIQHNFDKFWDDLTVTSSNPDVAVVEMKDRRDRVGVVLNRICTDEKTTIRIEVK